MRNPTYELDPIAAERIRAALAEPATERARPLIARPAPEHLRPWTIKPIPKRGKRRTPEVSVA
ncbi:MAG TPA: hypothetical protein VGF86_09685 [Candidatus Tumulicola sp.]|jgi:hypothetical protein